MSSRTGCILKLFCFVKKNAKIYRKKNEDKLWTCQGLLGSGYSNATEIILVPKALLSIPETLYFNGYGKGREGKGKY